MRDRDKRETEGLLTVYKEAVISCSGKAVAAEQQTQNLILIAIDIIDCLEDKPYCSGEENPLS